MKVMATGARSCARRVLPMLAKKDGSGPAADHAQGLHAGDRRQAQPAQACSKTDEVRDKLTRRAFAGPRPLSTYMLLPLRHAVRSSPSIALLYLFVITDYDYPVLVKIGSRHRRRLHRLLSAQHLHREPASQAPADLDHERLPGRARHAADLRRVGHVDRGGVPEGQSGEVGATSLELAEELTLTTAELSYLQDRRQAYDNLGQAHRHPRHQVGRHGPDPGRALRYAAGRRRCASWPRRTARCACRRPRRRPPPCRRS